MNQETIQVSKQPRTTVAVRWRIVPGILFLVFGTILMLGVLFELGAAVYFNIEYGWIVPTPENSALHQIAFTSRNILRWQFGGWASISALVASWMLFHRKWKFAWIAIGLIFACFGAGNLVLILTD